MSYPTASFMSFADVVSRAAQDIHDRAYREIPYSVLRGYVSEASREFARLSECVRGLWSGPLVTGQRLYRLPHDCMRVKRVVIQYPGEVDSRQLCLLKESALLDGVSRSVLGLPEGYYVTGDRESLGIYPVPALGGLEFQCTGGSTTTVILPAATAPTTDDVYNDMTIIGLDGANEGAENTISDYVASTRTVTVDPAWSLTTSGDRFQIHPESLQIDYVARGNEYTFQPTDGVVNTAVTPNYDTFSSASTGFNFPADFFKGFEVFFTSGACVGLKSRIRTSSSPSTNVVFTLDPVMPAKPANTDTFTITECPNVPPEFAHYLADYAVAKALAKFDPRMAQTAMAAFMVGVRDAIRISEIGQLQTTFVVKNVYRE